MGQSVSTLGRSHKYVFKGTKMRSLSVILLVATTVSGTLALSREKREDCGAQIVAYSECGAQAAASVANIDPTDASAIPKAGCSMMQQMLACNKKVTSACNNVQFKDMMKKTVDGMLNTLKQMPGWDEKKCKPVQDYLNGKSGASEKVVSVSVMSLILAVMYL